MKPQQIIEDMLSYEHRMGARLPLVYHPYYWHHALSSASEAVHFDFADVRPASQHCEFGLELFKARRFALPFHTVLYSGAQWEGFGVLARHLPQDEGLLELIVFNRAGHLPLSEAQIIDIDAGGELVMNAHILPSKAARDWDGDPYEACAGFLCSILSATALLMSKDVETRVEAAPDKLNKAREARGKPLIRERRVVVIKPERRASYANAAAEFGGLRASPRMHWRRGHFRRVRDDLVVPVPPTIVGGNGGSTPTPAKKDYRIQ